jgi:hypothetical protein
MGVTKGRYQEEFSVGSFVRVADRRTLDDFLTKWKYHHPLEPGQLEFANVRAKIASVGFYHGGDELYELEGVPGIWHESCLVKDKA